MCPSEVKPRLRLRTVIPNRDFEQPLPAHSGSQVSSLRESFANIQRLKSKLGAIFLEASQKAWSTVFKPAPKDWGSGQRLRTYQDSGSGRRLGRKLKARD